MDRPIVGVDEVGNGALAGPLLMCAYAGTRFPLGLKDSKQMGRKKREDMFLELVTNADFLITVSAPAWQIRERGLGEVWKTVALSCIRAAHAWRSDVDVLIDGNRGIRGALQHRVLPKADQLVAQVSAASVVAKVTRDRHMSLLSSKHQGYGWERNSGYGTKEHKRALQSLGATYHHRYERVHEQAIQQSLPFPQLP